MLISYLTELSPQYYTDVHWSISAMLIIVSTFISEDLTAIGVGLAAQLQLITLPFAMLTASIGIILGDLLLYLIGRLLRKGFFLSMKRFAIEKTYFPSSKKKNLVIVFYSYLALYQVLVYLPTYGQDFLV